MPARRQRAGLRLPVTDDAEDDQARVVEGRAEGMHQRVAELATLVDGPGRLGRHMAADAARERELVEEPLHARLVARQRGVDLAGCAFEVGIGDRRRPAVPGPDDPDRVEVARLDHPAGVGVDQVQPRGGPPVAQQPRLHVLGSERLAEEGVVQQVDLPHREVVRGAPVGVDGLKLGAGRRPVRRADARGRSARQSLISHVASPACLAAGRRIAVGPVTAQDYPSRAGLRPGRRSLRSAPAWTPRTRRCRGASDGGPSGAATRAR